MHNLQNLLQEYLVSGSLKKSLGGTSTGYASLDQLTNGWYPGTVNLVFGRPDFMISVLLVNFLYNLKGQEVDYISDWRTEFAILQMLLGIEVELPLLTRPESRDLNVLQTHVKPKDWQNCLVKYQPEMTKIFQSLEESGSQFCFLDLKQLPALEVLNKIRTHAHQKEKIIILGISLPHVPKSAPDLEELSQDMNFKNYFEQIIGIYYPFYYNDELHHRVQLEVSRSNYGKVGKVHFERKFDRIVEVND